MDVGHINSCLTPAKLMLDVLENHDLSRGTTRGDLDFDLNNQRTFASTVV